MIPAAGRGDTDSGGDAARWRSELWNRLSDFLGQHGPTIDSIDDDEHDELLTAFIDGLERDVLPQVCPTLPAARPAGDRAQPTEELREEIARAVWFQTGTAGERAADALLAGPLAALLDAQAKVESLRQVVRLYEAGATVGLIRQEVVGDLRELLGDPS